MEWLWAGVAIVGSFIIGIAASAMTKRILERRGARTAQLATPVASIVLSLIFVVGLLVALGIVRSESLSELRDDTINYLPRALSALIVVILGSVVGTIASTAARESMGNGLGRLGDQVPTVIKSSVTAFAVILAASQLGIDTTVINIVVASVVFGLALAAALVIGFGSRPVATEIASGRALRRLVTPGDAVVSSTVRGTVVAMHPTAVEIEQEGHRVLVPNTELADSGFQIKRPKG